MNRKYTSEEKPSIYNRYLNGESVNKIVADTGIPRSSVYSWIKQHNQSKNNSDNLSLKRMRILENKITCLEGIIEILKTSNCLPSDPLSIKLPILESLNGKYSVHMLCEALDVPRGTFYNYIFRNKRTHTWYAKRQEELRPIIQQIYDDSNQIFGAAKVAAVMKEMGHTVSVETVRKLMRDMGLISVRQEAKPLYDKEQSGFKNHLNQQFSASEPNKIWVSDVTYFKYDEHGFYICVIIDIYSRVVVA